jgi:hypothetical protein
LTEEEEMGTKDEISSANGLVHDEVTMEEGRGRDAHAYEKGSTPNDTSGMLTVQFTQKVGNT